MTTDDEAIPLAGDEDRVYTQPKTVSTNYTTFTTEFGAPEQVASLPEDKLLACAKRAVALKNYFRQKYDPVLAVIETAALESTSAKSMLVNVTKTIEQGMEKGTHSILDAVMGTFEEKTKGANQPQALALCQQIAKAVENLPGKYGHPKGKGAVPQAFLQGLAVSIESFLRAEIVARFACTQETLVRMGYKEEGAYAARIERRASIMTKLKGDTENALGWHNQEISFWMKRVGEAMRSKDALIAKLDSAEKSALGLTPPESKIRFGGGGSGAKWTPGKPTWDGTVSGQGGFDVDSNQR